MRRASAEAQWRMRRFATIAVVVSTILLGACGAEQRTTEQPSSPPTTGVPEIAADLIVTTSDETGTRSYRLTCAPPGGDHPRAEAACKQLNQAGPSAFAPPPSDQACTEIYGGPHIATVTGTFGDDPVEARFSRTNGCEIDRWDGLDHVLGRFS